MSRGKSMRRDWIGLAALLLLAFGAAIPTASAAEKPSASLTDKLLVATREMGDPRFRRTVIYICRHNDQGAFGLVLNRGIGETTIAAFMRRLGLPDAKGTAKVDLRAGGPVAGNKGFILHSKDFDLVLVMFHRHSISHFHAA